MNRLLLLGLLALPLLAPIAAAEAPLGRPTNLRVTAGHQELHIAWDPVPGAAGYYVYVSVDGREIENRSVTATEAVFIGRNNHDYVIQVAAHDGVGEPGPRSAPAVGTPTFRHDAALLAVGLAVVAVAFVGYAFHLARLGRRLKSRLRIPRDDAP